jgi:hypothetical protein
VEAGFTPKQRDSLYRIVNVPDVDDVLAPREAVAEPLPLV